MMLTRTLPVKLTDDEVAIRSQELAEVELERLQRTQDLEAAAEGWREEKKMLENAAAASVSESVRLARIVKYREEQRDVACVVAIESGQYIVTRTDTGEVVVERAASSDELQASLFEKNGDEAKWEDVQRSQAAVDEAITAAIEADGPVPQSEQ